MRRGRRRRGRLRFEGGEPSHYVEFSISGVTRTVCMESWWNDARAGVVHYDYFTPAQVQALGEKLIEWAKTKQETDG
jgi:hypothetical protein